jgi:BASS family bile acid:Na+ symporter
MFGMGTEMSLSDFAGVIKTPKSVLIGVSAQFIIMPLVGYAIATGFGFEPEVAAGIVLVGSVPCGVASNVISYLAKANVALSVTLTAVGTLLAPIITPLWMKVLAGQFIEVDVMAMVIDIIKIVIVPIAAGLVFNALLKGKLSWLDKAMPIVSMTGIALIIVVITAAGRDNLMKIGLLLIFAAFLHNTAGYLLGYWSGKLFGLKERDCRTIAIEVGLQNAGLASGLSNAMGRASTIGLASAVFGPVMNTTGSILASYWHRKPLEEQQ